MVGREQDDNASGTNAQDKTAADRLGDVAEKAGAQPGTDDPQVPPDSTGYSAPPLDADTP